MADNPADGGSAAAPSLSDGAVGTTANQGTDTAVSNVSPSTSTSVDTPASSSQGSGETTTNQAGEAPPADLLSVVRAVLKPETAEPSTAAGSGAGEPAPKDGSGASDPAATPEDPNRDLTEADFADVEKPSVKKRLDTLIKQRGEARAEATALRETAGNWNSHVNFLQQHNVSPQDLQNVYGLLQAFGSGDWPTFVTGLKPYYEIALRQMGEIIPEDLQRRIDTGDLTIEDAREISTARARASTSETQRVLADRRHEADANQQRAFAVQAAMDQWERTMAQRDPDWALKQAPLQRYAQALVAERGYAPDPATAVQWVNEAYAEVNKLWTSARPAPRPTQVRPSSAANGTPRARPEPTSVMEAARMALEKMRA